jgi:hypothetical protein
MDRFYFLLIIFQEKEGTLFLLLFKKNLITFD